MKWENFCNTKNINEFWWVCVISRVRKLAQTLWVMPNSKERRFFGWFYFLILIEFLQLWGLSLRRTWCCWSESRGGSYLIDSCIFKMNLISVLQMMDKTKVVVWRYWDCRYRMWVSNNPTFSINQLLTQIISQIMLQNSISKDANMVLRTT